METNPDVLRETADQLRKLAEISDKTAGDKLDSDKILDFVKFFVGKGTKDGK